METQFVNVEEYGKNTEKILPKMYSDYYQSGSDDSYTLNTTKYAYQAIKLKARALGNADAFEGTETTFLGHRIASPICLAPTAMHKLAYPDGELATARACGNTKTLQCLSQFSSCSLEDVANVSTDNILISQAYYMRDPELNKDFIERLEKSGYKAIVLTVDSPVLGNREGDVVNSLKLFPGGEYSSIQKYLDQPSKYGCSSGWEFFTKYKHDGYGWRDIKEIKKLTKLPIVLKGIQCAEDAKMAVESGADAIWVSNHGGRQLDTVPATIEVLEEGVKAVEGKIEVYFDGGVRRGTDVLKALALGAQAVFIGRPQLWGLACNGQKGVEDVINILNKELKKAMILTDCKNIKEVTKEKVIHTAYSNPRYFMSKM